VELEKESRDLRKEVGEIKEQVRLQSEATHAKKLSVANGRSRNQRGKLDLREAA
jgi:hypothetical protein